MSKLLNLPDCLISIIISAVDYQTLRVIKLTNKRLKKIIESQDFTLSEEKDNIVITTLMIKGKKDKTIKTEYLGKDKHGTETHWYKDKIIQKIKYNKGLMNGVSFKLEGIYPKSNKYVESYEHYIDNKKIGLSCVSINKEDYIFYLHDKDGKMIAIFQHQWLSSIFTSCEDNNHTKCLHRDFLDSYLSSIDI